MLFLIFLSFISYGQTGAAINRNETYKALYASKEDSAKLPLLHKMGEYYLLKYKTIQQRRYLDSALTIYKKAVNLSKAIHLDHGNGRYKSLLLLGSAYVMEGDTNSAKYCFMQNINYYSKENKAKELVASWAKYCELLNQYGFLKLAMPNLRQVLQVAIKNKLYTEEVFIRCCVVYNLRASNHFNEAIAECLFTIKKFGKSGQNLDRIYFFLANCYRYQGDMNKALFYSLLSINELELHKNISYANVSYGETAQIYDMLGLTEKSIIYYKKTLRLREKMVLPEEQILRTVGFLINGLIKLGRFKEALKEAKDYEARMPPKTNIGKASMAQNLAYCYQALKNNVLAERYYLVMMKNYDKMSNEDEATALACYDIGCFYASVNRFDKAKIYLQQMSSQLLTMDVRKKTEHLCFRVDSGMGNFSGAMKHYIKYQSLKDSIFNENKSKQIEELQVKYETDQKEKDIQLLRKDGQLQRDGIKQAKIVRNFTFAGISVISLAMFFLFISYRGNRIKSKEINRKNASLNLLIEEKDGLIKEKEWLIKEVHHRVKNNLQIVMALLQQQSAFTDNKEALAAIQNSEQRMYSIALIHQKLYQSETLRLVNMVDYVEEMIGYLRDSCDLGKRIRIEKQIVNVDFEIGMAVPLGLILNEAVTNAIKYAFLPNVNGLISINLNTVDNQNYLLEIKDNGRGLSPEVDVLRIGSMGFNLIRGLSKQLGGTFSVINSSGLTVIVSFKMNKTSI